MPEADNKIRLSDIPNLLEKEYGRSVTRETVYNWSNRGVRGNVLKTVRILGLKMTTKEWLDDFLGRLS